MSKKYLLAIFIFFSSDIFANQCAGHFINPITDICWSCLFPISIGDATVVGGDNPDTANPSSPIQVCPMAIGWRVGLAIGYWEPFATVDVTRSPYCLVNLGGIKLNIAYGDTHGATESAQSGTTGAFYQVHWYKYPLIYWLNLITSVGCLEGGDYDIGYVSELDPMWHDDELSFLVNPEDAIFSNPITQLSCVADATSALTGSAINQLFWCMGSQGSTYPLTGSVSAEYSPFQNSVLLAERMDFKLHLEGLIKDSQSENVAVCHQTYMPIMPKNRYRYEMENMIPDSNSCHPFGHSVTTWQMGKITPADKGNYGYLIWRKRNCTII